MIPVKAVISCCRHQNTKYQRQNTKYVIHILSLEVDVSAGEMILVKAVVSCSGHQHTKYKILNTK